MWDAEDMEPVPVLGESMRRFTEMLVAADPTSSVPSCPKWTVAELAAHLGQVHRWSAGVVLSAQFADTPQVWPSEPIAEWYASQATALLAALAAVEDDEPVPNFTSGPQTALFWKRRQAHETVVHCVDLAQATGTGFGVIPAIGADGIDELLHVAVSTLHARRRGVDVPAPITIRATDVDRSWTLRVVDETLQIADGAAPGALIEGTAVDLYLGLWGRTDRSALTVHGAAAERFLAGRITP